MTTTYAKIGSDGALWGTLFEKAFAKFYGNYETVDAGHGASGIEAAIGAPYTSWDHEYSIRMGKELGLWYEMLSYDG